METSPPTVYCTKCGVKCEVSHSLSEYDRKTGKLSHTRFWVACPKSKWWSVAHTQGWETVRPPRVRPKKPPPRSPKKKS